MLLKYHLKEVPTTVQYLNALSNLDASKRPKPPYCKLLKLQYLRPNHTITAKTVSQELNMAVLAINGYYGRLGHWLADEIGIRPSQREGGGYRWWCVLSSGETQNGLFQWQMYTELANAVEQFGILETTII